MALSYSRLKLKEMIQMSETTTVPHFFASTKKMRESGKKLNFNENDFHLENRKRPKAITSKNDTTNLKKRNSAKETYLEDEEKKLAQLVKILRTDEKIIQINKEEALICNEELDGFRGRAVTSSWKKVRPNGKQKKSNSNQKRKKSTKKVRERPSAYTRTSGIHKEAKKSKTRKRSGLGTPKSSTTTQGGMGTKEASFNMVENLVCNESIAEISLTGEPGGPTMLGVEEEVEEEGDEEGEEQSSIIETRDETPNSELEFKRRVVERQATDEIESDIIDHELENENMEKIEELFDQYLVPTGTINAQLQGIRKTLIEVLWHHENLTKHSNKGAIQSSSRKEMSIINTLFMQLKKKNSGESEKTTYNKSTLFKIYAFKDSTTFSGLIRSKLTEQDHAVYEKMNLFGQHIVSSLKDLPVGQIDDYCLNFLVKRSSELLNEYSAHFYEGLMLSEHILYSSEFPQGEIANEMTLLFGALVQTLGNMLQEFWSFPLEKVLYRIREQEIKSNSLLELKGIAVSKRVKHTFEFIFPYYIGTFFIKNSSSEHLIDRAAIKILSKYLQAIKSNKPKEAHVRFVFSSSKSQNHHINKSFSTLVIIGSALFEKFSEIDFHEGKLCDLIKLSVKDFFAKQSQRFNHHEPNNEFSILDYTLSEIYVLVKVTGEEDKELIFPIVKDNLALYRAYYETIKGNNNNQQEIKNESSDLSNNNSLISSFLQESDEVIESFLEGKITQFQVPNFQSILEKNYPEFNIHTPKSTRKVLEPVHENPTIIQENIDYTVDIQFILEENIPIPYAICIANIQNPTEEAYVFWGIDTCQTAFNDWLTSKLDRTNKPQHNFWMFDSSRFNLLSILNDTIKFNDVKAISNSSRIQKLSFQNIAFYDYQEILPGACTLPDQPILYSERLDFPQNHLLSRTNYNTFRSQVGQYTYKNCLTLSSLITKFHQICQKENIKPYESSCADLALALFQQNHLKESITALDHDEYLSIRDSYFEGVCQAFTNKPPAAHHKSLYKYNINTLNSATLKNSKIPISLHKHVQAEFSLDYEYYQAIEDHYLYEVVEFAFIDECKYPLFPIREQDGHIYYYRQHTGRCLIWGQELNFALGRGLLKKLNITSYYVFVAKDVFRDYMNDLRSKWINSSREDDQVSAAFYELMMENLYKKFTEKSAPKEEYVNIDKLQYLCKLNQGQAGPSEIIKKSDSIYLIRDNHPENTGFLEDFIHISSFINSCGRLRLWEAIYGITNKGKELNVLYCDTDFIITTQMLPAAFISEKEIGKWRLDMRLCDALFLAPGVYYLKKMDTNEVIMEIKGVSHEYVNLIHYEKLFSSGECWLYLVNNNNGRAGVIKCRIINQEKEIPHRWILMDYEKAL